MPIKNGHLVPPPTRRAIRSQIRRSPIGNPGLLFAALLDDWLEREILAAGGTLRDLEKQPEVVTQVLESIRVLRGEDPGKRDDSETWPNGYQEMALYHDNVTDLLKARPR
jgi:hypothetical protein